MAVTELEDTDVYVYDKHDVEDEYHFVLICSIYLHFIMSFYYVIFCSKDQAFICLLN